MRDVQLFHVRMVAVVVDDDYDGDDDYGYGYGSLDRVIQCD